MCTLYVVDWYNRTYLSPHFHHYHPYIGEGTEKQQKHQKPTDSQPIPSDIDRPPPPGKMRGLLDSDWIPPLQSNILPISLQYCSTNFDKNNPFISGNFIKLTQLGIECRYYVVLFCRIQISFHFLVICLLHIFSLV